MVFPALYNGPVNYFARLIREEKVILEQFDHYTKQTYRNRFRIMGPNGLMTLSVPVKRERGEKTQMRDILVDYDTPWNKIHWRSLVGAYASSPFFHLMEEEFSPFYHRHFRYLLDLNIGLIETTLGLIGANVPVSRTKEFRLNLVQGTQVQGLKVQGTEEPDRLFHSKKKAEETDPGFRPPQYHQVFSERSGFMPNLSILDLLFNEGPNTLMHLKQSLRT